MRSDHFDWVIEPLCTEPSFLQKPMFGCLAYYLFGRLVLVTSTGEEPWKGLLIPTEKSFHPALLEEFPDLKTHPVLPKWLYLPEDTENFEETAGRVAALIRSKDPRVGVEPSGKDRTRKKRRTSGGS